MFDAHLARWGLTPDGEPINTHSSNLLPVRRDGTPAMLKIAWEAGERWGGLLMVWWRGDGAARVLTHAGDALLLERAQGKASLVEMAQNGCDDEASHIICAAAARYGGILRQAAAAADELLAHARDIVVLHGDLRHGDVLDAGPHGWLAIGPKRLVGERGFDFANVFRNPDLETATAPGRLARQATVVAEAAGLERRRPLKWILAYAGLSAAWILGDGEEPTLDLAVAELAAAELASA